MLFNSLVFLFGFLPIALAGYFVAGRIGRNPAAGWLVAASLVFYGWWQPRFLAVLLGSVVLNYAAATALRALEARPRTRAGVLALAIAANISCLVYYKYLTSLLVFLNESGVGGFTIHHIELPLGISFFTFIQIGYLVDVSQGTSRITGPLQYMLFVTFFPHLIAGPILHNREMMPQYQDPATFRPSSSNLAVGGTIFVMGLLKKCVLADPISSVVPLGFAHPGALGVFEAWNVALSYSLQLYFDFSGYSDMAIGLARMFNIRFPLNFNSPYKAASITDYWARWHMTLTRYLTLYLYNPFALAITRRRVARGLSITRKAYRTPGGFASIVVAPTFLTMGLAGVWHGAGLQFLVFGLLHAAYLSINHAWRVWRPEKGRAPDGVVRHVGKVALTYLVVLVAAVFFRAPSCAAAMQLLYGMSGWHGIGPASPNVVRLLWLAGLYAIVWFAPNTQQVMRHYAPALDNVRPWVRDWPTWRPSPQWALVMGVGAMLALLATSGTAEFLYFQF